MKDVRYALRTLRRSPWYSAIVVCVLGVSMGLATVVFAVVDGVLFKPLPYHRPLELYLVHADVTSVSAAQTTDRTQPPLVSGTEIAAWREAVPELPLTVVSSPYRFKRTGGREYWAAEVDEQFFDVMGMRPWLGGFAREDFDWWEPQRGRGIRPLLVSYRYWHQVLGGDPAVIGRTVDEWEREGTRYGERIAGVLPPQFVFPLDPDEPQPEVLSPMRVRRPAIERLYHVLLRVPSGSDPASPRDRLVVATRHAATVASPAGHSRHVPFDSVRLVPATDQLGRHERPAFALVLSGAAVLLLLACLNVAGLTAARNVERRRDLAVRRALGATVGVIARSLLWEIGLLAIASAAVALLLAKPLLVWTLSLLPATVVLLKTPALDVRVLLALVVCAAATVMVVALWPARVAMKFAGPASLGGLSPASTRTARRSGFVLVAGQLALSFVLTTAGALTVASLTAAWLTDTGYRRDRMILVEAYIRTYTNGTDATQQLEQVEDLLMRVPGVDRVATSSIQPFFDSSTQRAVNSFVPRAWTAEPPAAAHRKVSADFFDVMDIRLVDGAWPRGSEWTVERPVAIVSETVARTVWPGRSAIGQELVARGRPSEPGRIVVAVVADTRYSALDREPIGDIYTPDRFEPGRTGVFFHVRTANEAAGVVPLVMRALRAREILANQVSTHEDALFASVKHRALPAWLFGSLGLVSLVLTAAGILGLLGMLAAQRTREMGIRIALGATTSQVVGLLFQEQVSAVATGLIGGAVVSVWSVRLIQSQLYHVRAFDPALWSAVAVAVVLVSAIGTLIPSMRAARVDPVQALRAE